VPIRNVDIVAQLMMGKIKMFRGRLKKNSNNEKIINFEKRIIFFVM